MATTQKWSAWRRRPPLSIVMAYFASHASDHAAGLAFNADFVVATVPALELGHGGRLTR